MGVHTHAGGGSPAQLFVLWTPRERCRGERKVGLSCQPLLPVCRSWLLGFFYLFYAVPLSHSLAPACAGIFAQRCSGRTLSIMWDEGTLLSLRGLAVTLLILYLYAPEQKLIQFLVTKKKWLWKAQQRSTTLLISMLLYTSEMWKCLFLWLKGTLCESE